MTTTKDSAIQTFMTRQISFMQSMDEKGLRPLRIWNKLLSKPKLDENGVQMTDENGKPERELIADHNGELIDDSSYILSTSESLAKTFDKLIKSLSGTKEYCSIELLDPVQVSLKDSELQALSRTGGLRYLRFNLIKVAFNDSTKAWEIYTVRHKAVKSLSFSQCYKSEEVPVDADEVDIDI